MYKIKYGKIFLTFILVILLYESISIFYKWTKPDLPEPNFNLKGYWKFLSRPTRDDGSDGVLLSEKLNLPIWNISVYHNSRLPQPICEPNKLYSLIIVVNSAGYNFNRRNHIRSTWGTLQPQASNETLKVIFMVARSRNVTIDKLLMIESQKYQDILMGDFIDDYKNNTLKTIYSHYRINQACKTNFLLKTDDDVYVNVIPLLENIKYINPKSILYAGLILPSKSDRAVVRSESCSSSYICKWATERKVWPFEYHVKFARGLGVLLSKPALDLLVNNYKYIYGPLVHTDDPYVAYVLKRSSVSICEIRGFHDDPIPYSNVCQLNSAYVIHYRGKMWPGSLNTDAGRAWRTCKTQNQLQEDISSCQNT